MSEIEELSSDAILTQRELGILYIRVRRIETFAESELNFPRPLFPLNDTIDAIRARLRAREQRNGGQHQQQNMAPQKNGHVDQVVPQQQQTTTTQGSSDQVVPERE
uniref:Uncharacterized protein n=1 Tax=Meloidogyne javanica TaxID=6303 RepID=A0A915LUR5_MELJA